MPDERCPRCDSPQPQLHPALQHEGEVHICPDPWHLSGAPDPKGRTANELRDMGYTVADAVRDGYLINEDDDRFIVAYKGSWPDTDEFVFMHREGAQMSDDNAQAELYRLIYQTGVESCRGVMDVIMDPDNRSLILEVLGLADMWLVYRESDMTEGRGSMVALMELGLFQTEQAAWDAINEAGGVMGRHPRNFDWGPWAGAGNWQQYKEKNGHFAEYDVRPVKVNQ